MYQFDGLTLILFKHAVGIFCRLRTGIVPSRQKMLHQFLSRLSKIGFCFTLFAGPPRANSPQATGRYMFAAQAAGV
jgi:hypothetical protein